MHNEPLATNGARARQAVQAGQDQGQPLRGRNRHDSRRPDRCLALRHQPDAEDAARYRQAEPRNRKAQQAAVVVPQ